MKPIVQQQQVVLLWRHDIAAAVEQQNGKASVPMPCQTYARDIAQEEFYSDHLGGGSSVFGREVSVEALARMHVKSQGHSRKVDGK